MISKWGLPSIWIKTLIFNQNSNSGSKLINITLWIMILPITYLCLPYKGLGLHSCINSGNAELCGQAPPVFGLILPINQQNLPFLPDLKGDF